MTPPRPLSRPILPLLLGLGLGLSATPALAKVDAACKPVLDANAAKVAAPAFHDRKQLDGMTLEMIKVGEQLYVKQGSRWRQMSNAAGQTLGGFDAGLADGSVSLTDCRKLGRETVEGRSLTVYQYTTTVHGAGELGKGSGKLWIGDDGRPYRDSTEGQQGSTTYTGVSAPEVQAPGKKK